MNSIILRLCRKRVGARLRAPAWSVVITVRPADEREEKTNLANRMSEYESLPGREQFAIITGVNYGKIPGIFRAIRERWLDGNGAGTSWLCYLG